MSAMKHKLNLNKKKLLQKNNIQQNKFVSSQTTFNIPVPVPAADVAFKALLSARFCSAMWAFITDCDETFNYWEPLHYLINNHGLQTWEYSPEFALRSYTYLLVHGIPAWGYKMIFPSSSPMFIFYFVRSMLGFGCALAEVYFYNGVCREFGVHIARLWLIFQLFSAGMFISSTALLPSSFSMYMGTSALAAWFHHHYKLAIFFTAISTFLGWPFAFIIGIPIAFDIIIWQKKIKLFITWSLISTVTIMIPIVAIDSSYFGKVVIAPMNLILYNVFTSHGPDLYGVEPASYYFINGFLNFNLIWILALVTPLFLILSKLFVPSKSKSTFFLPHYLSLAPFYLWLLVFIIQPHKEERFLFPIYPMITLCGAITIDVVQKLYYRLQTWNKSVEPNKHYLDSTIFIAALIMIASTVLGMSRIFSLYRNYHAPMDLMMELGQLNDEKPVGSKALQNVCIGKDWYRFPSSFFFPERRYRLRFLKSEFKGMLPAYFSSEDNGTAIVHPYFNDLNQENDFMYFNYTECHFLLHLDTEKYTEFEPNYVERDEWTLVKSLPFLNNEQSNKYLRAFYIPFLSNKFNTFNNFNLLRRKIP